MTFCHAGPSAKGRRGGPISRTQSVLPASIGAEPPAPVSVLPPPLSVLPPPSFLPLSPASRPPSGFMPVDPPTLPPVPTMPPVPAPPMPPLPPVPPPVQPDVSSLHADVHLRVPMVILPMVAALHVFLLPNAVPSHSSLPSTFLLPHIAPPPSPASVPGGAVVSSL